MSGHQERVYPVVADLSVDVDATGPIYFTYLDRLVPVDLTGAVFTFDAWWKDGSLTLVTGVDPELAIEDQADPTTKGHLSLNLSPAQRQSLPVGQSISYRIKRNELGIVQVDISGDLVAIKRGPNNG